MTFPAPQFFRHDGFDHAFYESGPKDGPPIIFVHGWPEMAYSWHAQLAALGAAGYHAIAYDLRGFGHSAAPLEAEHYGIANMVSDLEALMDHLGLARTVICGHDWGGIIVWHAARMLGARVTNVISISTPHVRRAPADPIAIFRCRYGDDHYFVDFNDHIGRSDALFGSDPESFFRLTFRSSPSGTRLKSEHTHMAVNFARHLSAGQPALDGAVMDDAAFKVFADAYARSGFHGGLNLYRNTTANWKLAEGLSEAVTQASLMISPEDDVFLPPAFADQMVDTVPNLTRKLIPDCGHWAMWEKPEAINAAILEWLSSQGLGAQGTSP